MYPELNSGTFPDLFYYFHCLSLKRVQTCYILKMKIIHGTVLITHKTIDLTICYGLKILEKLNSVVFKKN